MTKTFIHHLATAVAFLCPIAGTAAAQSAADLARRLRSQVSEEGLMVWSARNPPHWRDFRGPPRLGTVTAAQTSSGVTYLLRCSGPRLEVAVLATFTPPASWVRPDIPRDPIAGPESLRHERTHFDLTELFARRLRRDLSTLGRACPGREGGSRRVFDRLAEESRREQERYDRETAHGMARDAQLRWERRVRDSLDSLGRYAEPARRD